MAVIVSRSYFIVFPSLIGCSGDTFLHQPNPNTLLRNMHKRLVLFATVCRFFPPPFLSGSVGGFLSPDCFVAWRQCLGFRRLPTVKTRQWIPFNYLHRSLQWLPCFLPESTETPVPFLTSKNKTGRHESDVFDYSVGHASNNQFYARIIQTG